MCNTYALGLSGELEALEADSKADGRKPLVLRSRPSAAELNR